ncbi:hypothetical protein QQG55_6245 [Brugia pahangi]
MSSEKSSSSNILTTTSSFYISEQRYGITMKTSVLPLAKNATLKIQSNTPCRINSDFCHGGRTLVANTI